MKASGRGDYCGTKLDKYGFPRGYCMRTKAVRVFQTGDVALAKVPRGARVGIHIGRVAVRASGSCKLGNADGFNAKILQTSSPRGPL
jgi:hypothetical protein